MTNTWGISGPVFLGLYLGALIVLWTGAKLHRRSLFRGRPGASIEGLPAEQIAYLTGGPQHAACTAFVDLADHDAVTVDRVRKVIRTEALPLSVTPLQAAVFDATGRGVKARKLLSDDRVAHEAAAIGTSLAAAGLLTTRAQIRKSRLWAYAGVALLVLGVVRVVAGSRNDKPVGLLIGEIVIVVLATIPLFRVHQRATKAAEDLILAFRRANPQLTPRNIALTGGNTALSVACYGTEALHYADPWLAKAAGVPSAHLGLAYAGGYGAAIGGPYGGSYDGGGGGNGGGCGG